MVSFFPDMVILNNIIPYFPKKHKKHGENKFIITKPKFFLIYTIVYLRRIMVKIIN